MLWTPPPLHDGEKKRNTLSHRMSLYEAARKPVRKNEGTPYPCEQRDLDGYLKHERDNSKARYITAIQATNELCDWLDHYKEPDASSLAALERLRDGIRLDPWGPDLVIKAFKDLDLAFFKGTLLGNVRVKWMCRTEWLKTIDPRCDSPMEVVGYTQPGPHAQCAIALNAHHHLLNAHRTPNPFREMWRTLLHEMCHAYLQVKCGRRSDRQPWPGDSSKDTHTDTYSGGHGTAFRRCIHAVHRRAYLCLDLSAISGREDYKEHS